MLALIISFLLIYPAAFIGGLAQGKLGSGLVLDHSQNRTVAAKAMAER